MSIHSSTLLVVCNRQNTVTKSYGRGQTRSSVAYGAYGWRKPQVSAPAIGFNGQRIEPLTECYSLGHGRRVYNPVLRRFYSPDRLSPFENGGLNAYVYCSGDPVNYEDPTGGVAQLIFNGLRYGLNKSSELMAKIIDSVPGFRALLTATSDEVIAHANRAAMVAIVGANVVAASTYLGWTVVARPAVIVTSVAAGHSVLLRFSVFVSDSVFVSNSVARIRQAIRNRQAPTSVNFHV